MEASLYRKLLFVKYIPWTTSKFHRNLAADLHEGIPTWKIGPKPQHASPIYSMLSLDVFFFILVHGYPVIKWLIFSKIITIDTLKFACESYWCEVKAWSTFSCHNMINFLQNIQNNQSINKDSITYQWSQIPTKCIYFNKSQSILMKDIPYLACEGEVWGVICECDVLSKLYSCICCAVCTILLYRTTIYQVYSKTYSWLQVTTQSAVCINTHMPNILCPSQSVAIGRNMKNLLWWNEWMIF